MHTTLESLGFKQTYSDAAVYIFARGDVQIILPVFVDDMTFASKSLDVIKQAIADLTTHFKLRDLGPTTEILGIKIDRNRQKRSLMISQCQYCVDMLSRFNMADCKPVTTPMEPGLCLSHDQSPGQQKSAISCALSTMGVPLALCSTFPAPLGQTLHLQLVSLLHSLQILV